MSDIDPAKPYIIKLPGLLAPDECASLIARIESLGPKTATINTRAGARVRTEVRNNERVIFDDPELAEMLLERARRKARRGKIYTVFGRK